MVVEANRSVIAFIAGLGGTLRESGSSDAMDEERDMIG